MSCPSASSCTAVGNYAGTEGALPLAEKWNGSSWSLESPPIGSYNIASLAGVSCESTTICMGVGRGYKSTAHALPFAERWNGSSWAVQTVPLPEGAESGELWSVQCISTTRCIGAGWYKSSTTHHERTIVENWNGTSWSVIATPNPGGSENSSLWGISCPSEKMCMAVGQSDELPLAESWDGSSWSLHKPPTEPESNMPIWKMCHVQL